ncbi:MAG: tetratricopeptide repeat protein [Pyrinomonadaceae bacterium]
MRVFINLFGFVKLGFLLALITFVVYETAAAQTKPEDGNRILPPLDGLVTIELPALDDAETDVAKHVKTEFEALRKTTAPGEISRSKLSNAYARMGMVFHAYSMWEPARRCYKNAILVSPKDFRWRHLLGLVLIERNEIYEGVELLRTATQLNPKSVASFVQEGNALLGVGLASTAQKAFESALAISPNDPAALYGLGQTEYAFGNYTKAASIFIEVLKIVPAANRVRYNLALSYRNLGETEKAKKELGLQGTIGVAVSDPLVKQVENIREGVRTRLQDAKTALEAGSVSDAKSIYESVLASEPNNVTALVNLGAIHVTSREYDKAEAMFEKAVEIDSENTNALYNLGVLYSISGKSEKSAAAFSKLLEKTPQDDDTRFWLARELAKSGNKDKAIEQLQIIEESGRGSDDSSTYLSELLIERKRFDQAFAVFEKAYTDFPAKKNSAASYAWQLLTIPEQAFRNPEKALEISQRLYIVSSKPEHGFLVVFSLASTGKCVEALELGKRLETQVGEQARSNTLELLLQRFEVLKSNGGCQ